MSPVINLYFELNCSLSIGLNIGVHYISFYVIKYVNDDDYTIYCRIWIAFLAVLSIYLTRISIIFISADVEHSFAILLELTQGYNTYLLKEPFEEGIWIITASLASMIPLTGKPFLHITERIKFLFYSKIDGISYVKSKMGFILFFSPTREWVTEEKSKKIFIDEEIKIKVKRNKIQYLSIPVDAINLTEVTFPSEYIKKLNNERFMEFGSQELYMASEALHYYKKAFLLVSESKEVEAIYIAKHPLK